MSASLRLKLCLVDGFQLQIGERTVDRLRTRKTEGLLAWLALHRGKGFSREALIARFWPEDDEAAGRRKLRLALHSIRSEVGDALATHRDQVSLADAWVDALDGDVEGELLPEMDFEGLAELRAVHEARRDRRLRERLKAQVLAEDREGAVGTLFALIEADPWEPRLYIRLYGELMAQGRRKEARSVAGMARAALGDDCPPELAAVAPALAPRRSFVGRGRLFSELVETLLGDREPVLAMLVGPGGAGKTRLAQEIAAVARKEEIEVRTVRLIGVAARDEAARLVEAALRDLLPEGAAFDVAAMPSTLLVLDNAEGLEVAARRWVSELVARGSLRVLVTSQTALPPLEPRVFEVPPLGTPAGTDLESVVRSEACQLFAREAEIELTPENAARVAAVCRRMGGLPLAVRHAAARLATTTLDCLLDSLASMRPMRGEEPRHRTVAACVEWSLSLGTEEQRFALRSLAVFEDAFRAETVEAMGIDLAELIELNWVVKRLGEEAHEILPPFREALRRETPETEGEAARTSIARILAQRVETELKARYTTVVDAMTVHQRDLQRGFGESLERGELALAEWLAVGLYHVKIRQGAIAWAREDLERFFGAMDEDDLLRYPHALNRLASAAYFQSDWDEAERLYRRLTKLNEPCQKSLGWNNLGLIALNRRRYPEARAMLERSLEDASASLQSQVARRLNLSEAEMALGGLATARATSLGALGMLEGTSEHEVYRGLLLLRLAQIDLMAGTLANATDWAQRAHDLFARLGERIRLEETEVLIAFLAARRGDPLGVRTALESLVAMRAKGQSLALVLGLALDDATAKAGIDWSVAPVWAERSVPVEERIEAREGQRFVSDEEWRARAERAMKRL